MGLREQIEAVEKVRKHIQSQDGVSDELMRLSYALENVAETLRRLENLIRVVREVENET
jgi:hypothetical protein